jgi:hypothetical protein
MIPEIIGVAVLIAVVVLSVAAVIRERRLQRRYDNVLVEVLKVSNSALLLAVRTIQEQTAEYDEIAEILRDLDLYMDFGEPVRNGEGKMVVANPALLNGVFRRAHELLQDLDFGDARTNS